ncbi:MAG: hypothetical protein HY200_04475, partial [Nitrospirae bacterium]|nr:hypothetical protein [Nitrospirota bacterium]
ISGGYDNTKEDLNITPPYSYIDSAGRAVYAIDLLTGTNLWEYSYRSSVTNDSTNSKFNMTYSIPSDLTAVDVNNNGTVDTLYVGDVGGQIWEFNVGYSSTSSWSGTVIFQSNPGADSSSGRKFFYPPDLSIESGYRALFAGTGDREHPKTSTSVVDRLYAIYDKSSYTAISKEGGTAPSSTNANPLLMDVTTNLTPTITGAGWYIRLNGTGTMLGEKSLSAPLLLNKEVTYTTYAPLLPSMSANACGTALGTGFVWSLNYANGNAFFDYNKDGTKDLSDRSKSLGSGIPSGVVVTVTQSGMSGLVGIGGGIEGVDLNTGASFNQIFWHQPY